MRSVASSLWVRIAVAVAATWSAIWVLVIYSGSAGSLGAGGGLNCTVMNGGVFLTAVLGTCACGVAAFEAFTATRGWRGHTILLLALGGAVLPLALVPLFLLLEPAHGCP